jgi:hypothetical protein
MKYGETLYRPTFIYIPRHTTKLYAFKYRCEPVPFIHKKTGSYFKNWYKIPKIANEMKQFYGNEEYVRGKRKPRNLPNPWDDFLRADSYVKYSWKKSFKCRKQWGKRR